jgi:hypothetical protein
VERDHRGAQHDAADHARRHRPRAAAPGVHGWVRAGQCGQRRSQRG